MSRRIFIPTANGPSDWQRRLADPQKQWRTGFSAKSLAYCWENSDGFPPEVLSLFSQSETAAFQHLELMAAFPEHQVILPPRRGHPSQNDLFVIAKDGAGQLVTVMIEGKASEPFGETLGRWNPAASRGKTERFAFLKETLGLTGNFSPRLRYQLFHRLASAVIEARRFNAPNAVMVVHSFSQSQMGFADYQNFLGLFGVQTAAPGKLYFLKETRGTRLHSGWALGDEKFLRM